MGTAQTKPEDILTQDEINELTDTFEMFDEDGGGTISVEELGQVMRALGQDPTEDELNAMVDDVDTDGSGAIEVDEFIMMMAKRSKGYEKEVKMAFKAFNKDGFITETEIRTIFTKIGENLSDKEIKQLMKEAGANEQGKINYKRFSTMMKGILEQAELDKNR